MIEVELRSFITKEQHDTLIAFFKKESKMFSTDEQVTYYFNAPVDVRLQRNNTHSKVWMKSGKMHSEAREEIEVLFEKDDFASLEKMFLMLGYSVKVKWFRERSTFQWKGFEVCVDSNKGYGYILEIEKKTDCAGKDKALAEIKQLFSELKIPITPKKTFDSKYQNYLKNWKKLTGGEQ